MASTKHSERALCWAPARFGRHVLGEQRYQVIHCSFLVFIVFLKQHHKYPSLFFPMYQQEVSEFERCGTEFWFSPVQSNPEIAKKLATCPFNARHLVPHSSLTDHIMKCSDKAFVEQDVGKRSPLHPEASSWNGPKVGAKWLSVFCVTAALGKLDLTGLVLLSGFLRMRQMLSDLACILLSGLLNRKVLLKTAGSASGRRSGLH